MSPDFFRVRGIPIEVILHLDDVSVEDKVADYLRSQWDLVTAWGYEKWPNDMLVLENPDNPDAAFFRVHVRNPIHSLRPFLDFKYLRYKHSQFPWANPMKDVLVGTYISFKDHITRVTNHTGDVCQFPYKLS